MKQIIVAKFEIDDDPDLSGYPDYQRSYMRNVAEVRAMKIKEFIKEEASEFSFL